MKRILFTCALIALLITPAVSSAYSESTRGGNLSVQVYPKYPAPSSRVTLELDLTSSLFDGAGVYWEVNGEPTPSGLKPGILETTVGNSGTVTTITAVVSPRTTQEIVKTIQINPASVDILIDPQTYTPPSYTGGARPTNGSTIGASAIVRARTTQGATIDQNTLIYTWKNNSETIVNEELGTISTNFETPVQGKTTVSLEVRDQTGAIGAYKEVTITPTSPQILFYEEHPTLGTQYQQILGQKNITQDEITVRAEPYFFSTSGQLTHAWSVNNTSASPKIENANLLTIRRPEGSSIQSNLSLIVKNISQLFQEGRASVTLTFGSQQFTF